MEEKRLAVALSIFELAKSNLNLLISVAAEDICPSVATKGLLTAKLFTKDNKRVINIRKDGHLRTIFKSTANAKLALAFALVSGSDAIPLLRKASLECDMIINDVDWACILMTINTEHRHKFAVRFKTLPYDQNAYIREVFLVEYERRING